MLGLVAQVVIQRGSLCSCALTVSEHNRNTEQTVMRKIDGLNSIRFSTKNISKS